MLGPSPEKVGEERKGAGFGTGIAFLEVQNKQGRLLVLSKRCFSDSRFHRQAHALDGRGFCTPPSTQETHNVFFCTEESDSVFNVVVKAVNSLFCHCACTSHLLVNIKRLKSTSFKLGSLKAIFPLSTELELLLSLMQIKVKLFYFLLKDLGKTNLHEGIREVEKLNEALRIYHSK